MTTSPISLTINGASRTLAVEPEMALLWVLRDGLGIPGFGMSGHLCHCATGVSIRRAILRAAPGA